VSEVISRPTKDLAWALDVGELTDNTIPLHKSDKELPQVIPTQLDQDQNLRLIAKDKTRFA